jgi:hypothetical protein
MGQSSQVTITLPSDAALVTEALLDKLEGPQMLDVRDPADVQALWALSAVLEKTLPQHFPEYKELVTEARTRLRASGGPPDASEPSTSVSGNSLVFGDLLSGDRCVAVIRPVNGGVAIGLSRGHGSECEVTLAASDVRRFKELLLVAESAL